MHTQFQQSLHKLQDHKLQHQEQQVGQLQQTRPQLPKLAPIEKPPQLLLSYQNTDTESSSEESRLRFYFFMYSYLITNYFNQNYWL